MKHALLFIFLTPSSDTPIPLYYFETVPDCIASLTFTEAEFRRQGYGYPNAVCVAFNFAPETSPRPQRRH